MAVALLLTTAILGGCRQQQQEEEEPLPQESTLEIKGDSMVYGLICDGTSDSVVVIWPFKGDPITYSCIDAKMQKRIYGRTKIGDWAGVMINPEDTTEVTMIIDLDQLKATWTYSVMPIMKEMAAMSKRMQRRMLANMPDSVKETFFVPREYGFTLKRNHNAQAVGHVYGNSSLEDDSPVIYPSVKNYKQWYTWNGHLLLVSGEHAAATGEGAPKPKPDVIDTLSIVMMTQDSLVLVASDGIRTSYHRQGSATEANAKAIKAEAKRDSMQQAKEQSDNQN